MDSMQVEVVHEYAIRTFVDREPEGTRYYGHGAERTVSYSEDGTVKLVTFRWYL